MKPAKPGILTINGGSSSLKFALFDQTDPSSRFLSGRIDRIGLEDARWVVTQANRHAEDCRVKAPDQRAAVRLLIAWLENAVGFTGIAAVGHRVVHGGSRYHQPERVTAELIDDLRKISLCDPDHLPGEIELIDAFRNHARDLGSPRQLIYRGQGWITTLHLGSAVERSRRLVMGRNADLVNLTPVS